MFADLHLHTCHSDGTYTPEELVREAVRHGLAAIAVTDHDTVAGCRSVGEMAVAAGLGFVAGTEITAEWDGRELHVLGYFVDPEHEGLRGAMERAQDVRRERVRDMVGLLQAQGVLLKVEQVFDDGTCRAPGRPHVARALVKGGHCKTLDEAFERYLKRGRPAWVPKETMAVERALELIHAAGGLAVLAHPALNRDDTLVERLAGLGLDGLECLHPKHNRAAAQRYEAMAASLGLAVTGGSDCHGRRKNRQTMGTVKMPMAWVDRLRTRHAAGRGPVDRPAME